MALWTIWCKLCGTFTLTNYLEVRKQVFKHIEDTMKQKEHYDKHILSTIQKDQENSKIEPLR